MSEERDLQLRLDQRTQELQASEIRFKNVILHNTDGVLIFDCNGVIRFINPAAAQLFCLPSQELIGSQFQYPYSLEKSTQVEIKSAEKPARMAELRVIETEWESNQAFLATFHDITAHWLAELEVRRSAARAEILAALSHNLDEAGRDSAGILMTVARQVSDLFGDLCVIRLLSEDRQWLEPLAYHHPDPACRNVLAEVLADPMPSGNGLLSQVISTGEAVKLTAVSPDQLKEYLAPSHWPLLERYSAVNLFLTPLKAQSSLVGLLAMVRLDAEPVYTPADHAFLVDIANRAALAVENSRLYLSVAQRARELDALHKATSALLKTIDVEVLLGEILDAVNTAIPTVEKGLLHLVARDTGRLQTRAVRGYTDPRIKKFTYTGNQGYVAKAVHERRPLLIEDTASDDPHLNVSEIQELSSIRSAIVAPLILEQKVLGALSLGSSQPSAFTPSDLRLLESFATTATAAIHNAILHAEVQKLAITDALTGLYNRRGFFELGHREVGRALRFHRPLSAIMLDIDNFKAINDTYGHAAGDQVLRLSADYLSRNVRSVDILGRYGGDEFCILLPETDLFTASSVAERLRQSVKTLAIPTEKETIYISISMGVTKVVPETTDLHTLLDRADKALYEAKQKGRDQVEVR